MKGHAFFILSITLGAVLVLGSNAFARPEAPAVIHGILYYPNGNPEINMSAVSIEAKINGVVYPTNYTPTGKPNEYYLQVASDDPETPEKEGGAAGDIIYFYVDGFPANETLAWPGSATTTTKDLYVHHPPVLATIGNKTVNESEALAFTISATDMDNDTITYFASSLPSGATLNATTGVFSWTPSYAQAGNYTVTFTASDGDTETVDPNETMTITVNNVNRAPVAYNMTRSVSEDALVDIPLAASDADGDFLTYSVDASPAHGTIEIWGCCIARYTPSANYFGTDSFTFRAHDGTNYSNIATVEITVSPVNDAPVLSAISDITVNELLNVTITPSATDVDNATLNYYINDSRFSWNGTSFIWTTTYTDAGAYSVKVTASDGALNDTRTLRVIVNNVNRAPVFSPLPANITFNEDTTQFFNFSEYLSDPDGDALDFIVLAAYGNITYNYTTRTLSAPQNWNGVDYVRVIATDGMNDTSSPDILVVVNPVNDAPVAVNIMGIATDEDTPTVVTLLATDVENDPLTYAIVASPSHGTLSGAAPLLTYTPDANYYGDDSFTYKANDGVNDSNVAEVTITVNPVNDAPVLSPVSGITATEHQNITITPSATDVDNASLIYSINDSRFAWNGTSYVWHTNYNDAGAYSILVTASDGLLNDTQAVSVIVSEATQTFTKNLFSGWNLVSVPVETENTTVESVLASINGNYTFLAAWDGSKKEDEVNWITYDPRRPAIFNTLKNINTTTGFWVFMANNSTLNITGKTPYRTNVTLYGRGSNPAISGWNLVGYSLLESRAPDTALAAVKNKTNVVFGNFEQPNYWESYIPYVGGTMGVMKQGYGYWIRANTTEDATLEYLNA